MRFVQHVPATICSLLVYYAAYIGNSSPTFRGQPIGPTFQGQEMVPLTSVHFFAVFYINAIRPTCSSYDLLSSGILHSVYWEFLTDVSGTTYRSHLSGSRNGAPNVGKALPLHAA